MSIKSIIRKNAGVAPSDTFPRIEIRDGAAAPRLIGRSYYWTTPSGRTAIQHPNAYGWPVRYHHSSRRIVVGRDWAMHRGLLARAIRPSEVQ